jgi:hypothetical protein
MSKARHTSDGNYNPRHARKSVTHKTCDEAKRHIKLIAQLTAIATALIISITLKTWGVPEILAMLAERVPDLCEGLTEFFAKL